ncbi:MAG: PaaI family thioesterase, partial [Nitrospiria bacterium]
MRQVLNRVLLEDNDCFGCGHLNPRGLKIEVGRDPEHEHRLVGVFHPTEDMTGFPGITHGGAIYTALDCLASWTPTILLSEIKAAWILRSAEIRYLRPAPPARPIMLSARIKGEVQQGKPVVVHAKACGEGEALLAEGR